MRPTVRFGHAEPPRLTPHQVSRLQSLVCNGLDEIAQLAGSARADIQRISQLADALSSIAHGGPSALSLENIASFDAYESTWRSAAVAAHSYAAQLRELAGA
jgi:hypothetical protein